MQWSLEVIAVPAQICWASCTSSVGVTGNLVFTVISQLLLLSGVKKHCIQVTHCKAEGNGSRCVLNRHTATA